MTGPRPLSPSQQRNRSTDALFRSQHGLVSRAQAQELLGFSRSSIERRLRSGQWLRVMPSVYASAAVLESRAQRLKAAELWAGEGAALSHRTALELWGAGARADFFELLTPQRRMPRPGIRMHRCKAPLPASHLRTIQGLTVTSLARTLVDMADLLGAGEELDGLLNDFFRRGLILPAALKAFLKDASSARVPGRRVLLSTLRRRRRGPPPTHAELEQQLERRLSRLSLVPTALEGTHRVPSLRIGFSEQRVALELCAEHLPIGHQESARLEQVRRRLRSDGWRLHGISYEELRDRPRQTVERLLEVLSGQAPSRGEISLPAVDWRLLRYRMLQLQDQGQLPEVLQHQSVGILIDSIATYGMELDPPVLLALRGIIDEFNAAPPFAQAL